ncbi:MAG: M28 family peptidase [Myxococcota bacterium]
MRSRLLLFSWLVVASCRSTPAPKPTPAPPDEVLALQGRRSEATELATSLCDTAGPRLAGSAGDALAVAWGVETMKRLGFSNVRAEPVTVPHWVRLAEEAEVTAPLRQPLAVTALGGSVSTPEGGVEGEVVEVTTFDQLDALAPGSLAGKILFANIPMFRANDGAGYGAVAKVRRLAGLKGTDAGALAALIRSVGTDSNRLAHTGAQGDAKLPAAALSVPDAELVHRLLARGPVQLKLRLVTRVDAPAQSANVVGEIPGRERPEELILLGAHLDSWDLGTGALDDGAGVGLVLDVGAAMKALPRPPKRTVRVVLFANEENGLAGAKAYGEAHAAELERHVLALEADSGCDRALAVRLLGSDAGKQALQTWASWLRPLSVVVHADDAEGGADTSVLRAAGVPQLDVRQDASRYFDIHHTANDTPDKLDRDAHTQVARTMATVVWLAAEQGVDFGRVPQDKRGRRWK